jgi:uncharacterized protein
MSMATSARVPRGKPRFAGAIQQRRTQLPWPKDQRFRILSIDGGGIRGIFPAAVLTEFERQFTGGNPISAYFDLVAGTSTGGILALGLGAGYFAADLLDLYVGVKSSHHTASSFGGSETNGSTPVTCTINRL